MSHNEHTGDGNKDGRKKFVYHVDNKNYESDASSLTGAQIKARIQNFNPAFQLFLEGQGKEPDLQVSDSEVIELDGGAKHFYTAPPATFGSAQCLA